MKVDDLMPYILAEVPGCPVPTVRFAIIQAAAELCREAHTWNEIQDPMTLIDGQHTYQLDAPTGVLRTDRIAGYGTPAGARARREARREARAARHRDDE